MRVRLMPCGMLKPQCWPLACLVPVMLWMCRPAIPVDAYQPAGLLFSLLNAVVVMLTKALPAIFIPELDRIVAMLLDMVDMLGCDGFPFTLAHNAIGITRQIVRPGIAPLPAIELAFSRERLDRTRAQDLVPDELTESARYSCRCFALGFHHELGKGSMIHSARRSLWNSFWQGLSIIDCALAKPLLDLPTIGSNVADKIGILGCRIFRTANNLPFLTTHSQLHQIIQCMPKTANHPFSFFVERHSRTEIEILTIASTIPSSSVSIVSTSFTLSSHGAQAGDVVKPPAKVISATFCKG